jgi:hypothetical protein
MVNTTISSYDDFYASVFFACALPSYVFFFFFRWAYIFQLRSLLFNLDCRFNFVDEGFGWFERRNVVSGNDDRCIL